MKITYVTIGNASNIHNWSGLEYNIAQTLKAQFGHVEFIGDLKITHGFSVLSKKILYRLIGKRFDNVRDSNFALQCSKQISDFLKQDTDVIFSPGSVATAFLETNKPKVIYSDATFANLLDTYVFDYCATTIKEGHLIEQKALDTASLIIYSSDYAAQSAIKNYQVNPDKVKVVPFGANSRYTYTYEQIKSIINNRSKKELNLLFIGVDWKRKGGDLAVKIVKKLNESGIPTNLHVVGVNKIPAKTIPNYVMVHGFISKSTREGEIKILNLMKRCHFLLLPTRAEAYGLVFCEANSMGLPSIATNVGGIPTIIKDNVNGKMFNCSDSEQNYVEYITSVFRNQNPLSYEDFALSSYIEYEKRLNWTTAGKNIKSLLEELL